jgi:uroporphyrin-III C-methyltransferase/precorrin-2 dehydrogenase/sirohydrochlorin ferrochelatase
MTDLLPLFVNLEGRRVLLVGGGSVAAAKLKQLLAVRAELFVVAPDVREEIDGAGVAVARRAFQPSDLDGAWLVVAAATPEVNQAVAAAAAERRIFVNAVDDPANASAFLSGVIRRDGVTLAISTNGAAPGLTGLLREGLDAVLPRDLGRWLREATWQRPIWRRTGVPMERRRPLLLEALNRLYASPSTDVAAIQASSSERGQGPTLEPARDEAPRGGGLGYVSLVGAGPGDPSLLTRRAAARLRDADLVLYDALVDPRVLRLARRAQQFYVGKRAGRHTLSQAEIHTIMIRQAHRGRRIVRLKGGDPFVFGRGGEEALALGAAGIPFEVVPGVSSAIAAAAVAGIPVTHRGLASAFLVISGHDEKSFAAAIEGAKPDGLTLVIMMGLSRRSALAGRLMASGWSRELAAAVVAGAWSPSEQVWRGTLAQLAAGEPELAGDVPAVIVVGSVAGLDVRDLAAETSSVVAGEDSMRVSRR